MFDEELMKHLIAYLEDYPEDIKLDDYREDTRVLISGRMGNANTWGSRNDFTVALNYDKAGNLKNIKYITCDEELKDYPPESIERIESCIILHRPWIFH